MKVADVQEGEVYARDETYPFVRRVLGIAFDGMVHYEEYYRDTGERFSTNRLCSATAFARWASLHLPEADKRRLKVAESQAADRCEADALAATIRTVALHGLTDEELVGELRRRGFVVRLDRP
jgi:hypothetical protein